MLILINPTYRNLSSDPKYKGDRFPFIGVRQFWKALADGGLIDEKVARNLPARRQWKREHTKQVQNELLKNKLFLTNIVKCCYNHSAYPNTAVIKDQVKILSKEVKIVRPEKIVAFGSLVYKTLTGKSIKLSQYWRDKMQPVTDTISGLNIVTQPCYFPVGRGNPQKAAEILRKLVKEGRRAGI